MTNPDFRVDYLLESRKCLREFQKQKPDQPEFWANLLGAIANATIASVPNTVAMGLLEQQAQQKAVHKHLMEQLDARTNNVAG